MTTLYLNNLKLGHVFFFFFFSCLTTLALKEKYIMQPDIIIVALITLTFHITWDSVAVNSFEK